ncbi:hypothetical protein EAG_01781 [Camponotus floridanus]|uniref:Uncharacterized protein n=1 Tax=Camponotus floridanus TaxID=104421 RepID=E2AGJ4_CAMFO|nr:hypothetical protein EAG_01781 [Camponotus floridanus]
MNERPLVLAIHLSPSLPIEVFEVFAEIIEVVTKKPVVLLYETRFGRPVAKDITDIDANSQLEVLRMVAGKQAEVGILEAPVIGCHKMTIIGAEFLQILLSLGPLPPYRIMINKALENTLAKELTTYLLNINQRKEWMDRLSPFGIVGFAENSTDFYNLDEIKSVITSVRYY